VNALLWQQVQDKCRQISGSLKLEEISRIPAVSASRKAYKACGKDPARYRLSAEALLRRVVNRGEIYHVNNVVDLLNLVSISTGFSIGGYDAEKIAGEIVFGIGEKDEPYEGIGRGELNIEGMPVFRDGTGAFGTSTSDSVRTSVTPETSRFLMVLVDYGNTPLLDEATGMSIDLLRKHAAATTIETRKVKI
ncbi:MAG: hypothetical protein EOM73_12070, partial [Bacteroidia bacterium]|nr:hypothetical protein [Bacteroidia bacterium]